MCDACHFGRDAQVSAVGQQFCAAVWACGNPAEAVFCFWWVLLLRCAAVSFCSGLGEFVGFLVALLNARVCSDLAQARGAAGSVARFQLLDDLVEQLFAAMLRYAVWLVQCFAEGLERGTKGGSG